MRIKVVGDSHIDFLLQICHKWCCYIWNRVRADASLNGSRQMSHMFWKRTSPTDLIVDQLLAFIVLLKHREQLDDVGILSPQRRDWSISNHE